MEGFILDNPEQCLDTGEYFVRSLLWTCQNDGSPASGRRG